MDITTGEGMFAVVWQFEIAEEKIAAFESAYGPGGRVGRRYFSVTRLSWHRTVARRLTCKAFT